MRLTACVLAAAAAVAVTGCATAETGSPTSVSDSGATVQGRVAADKAGSVEYWAQYGRTTSYGSETSHQTVAVTAKTAKPVSGVEIHGLARDTGYHYRLCASDSSQSGGPGCGADHALRTQSFACGETVRTSVRLTGTMLCGYVTGVFLNGLVVGADGIKIDLAGHTLAAGYGSGGGGGTGIIDAGHAGVTISGGGVQGGNAILLYGARSTTVRGVQTLSGLEAIKIVGGSANTVRGSTVSARAGGVSISGSDDAVVTGNRVSSTLAPGIIVEADRARVTRNDFSLDAEHAVPANAISVKGTANRVVDNRITGPWGGGGIFVSGGAATVVSSNEVAGVGPDSGDGILVASAATGTRLVANTANGNPDDGFEVRDASALLRGNHADDNGDFGIDAVAGVTDAGGNRASGNGNPLQCRNVFCQ